MMQSWQRKFFTIAIGQMASLIGSSAVQFALIWWIARETASPLMMGLAGFVAFLPMAIFSPAAGIAADRYRRKYICIGADLFIGLAAAVFAVLLWLFDMPLWTALLILFCRSVGNTFHQPAIQAMIPQFVPAQELVRVGGWNQMLTSGSFLLGPALGAALYAAFPLPVILLTDLLGAAIASLLLAFVEIPAVQRKDHKKRHIVREIEEGLEVFRKDRALALMMAAQTLCMVFYMPLSSFYPLMTSDYFQASAWHGSAVEMLYAAGMMVSAFLFGNVIRVRRHLLVSYLGFLGISVTSGACGLLAPTMEAWAAFAVLCGLMGAFGNVYSVPLVAYMQIHIKPERMGRAFSLMALTSSLAMPAGLLLSSPIAEKIGVHRWFFFSGIGMLLITVVCLLLHFRLSGKAAGRA